MLGRAVVVSPVRVVIVPIAARAMLEDLNLMF